MDARIDLVADLNDEDDEGLGWSTLVTWAPVWSARCSGEGGGSSLAAQSLHDRCGVLTVAADDQDVM